MPESLKKLPEKECISKMISYFHDNHPKWEDKQIIAVAYKECGASSKDFTEKDGFCPYTVLSRVRFIRGLESAIYTNDFTDIPTSTRISKAVNDNLPKLREDFPNKEEVDILKMAYDMARGVLDNSDFEVVKEEPVYFEIFVEDPEEFEEELKKQFAKQKNDDFDYNDWADFSNDGERKATFLDLKIAMRENQGRHLGKLMRSQDIVDIMTSKGFSLDSITNIMQDAFYKNQIDLQPGSGKGIKIDGRTLAWIGTLDFIDDAAQAKFFAQDKPVNSSNVAEIGYERGKLRIFFKNGGGYEYPVPSSWYTEMLNASSKGSYVWETLRGKTPGRVIDNPNKTTPGGVGGSIVPYFKVKGAAMGPDEMRKSVTGFLRAARKGKAKAGGVPIRKIPKPEYKAFKRFMKKGAGRFTGETAPKAKKPSSRKSTAPRTFKKIVKKALSKVGKKPKKSPKTSTEPAEGGDKSAVRDHIRRLHKALKNARKAKLDDIIIKAIENQIKTLEKSISDFTFEINYYNIVDDFTDDMRYFSGPITRAGNFEYNQGTKIKNYSNLTEVFDGVSHLPSFDSHNEDQIIGFAYNFTGNPDTEQIFSEGYTFNEIEEIADVSLDSDTKLPVSIRFLDANEGTNNPEQNITDLIHLAISVNRTDVDRCSSAGGKPCYVQFQDTKDFIENTLEQVGDFMPEDKKKKKEEEEKKPPKDKDDKDEEDKEDKKKKGSSDQANADEDKDEESKDFAKGKKGKKGKNSKTENMIQIDKSVLEDFSKQLSDLKKADAARQRKADNMERDKIIGDFSDKTHVYKIKSDFFKTADLTTMKILESALNPVNEEVDAQNQLFNSDFNIAADDLQGKLENIYNVGKNGGKK